MERNLIQAIEHIVEEACAAQANIFGNGIWTHHIPLVARNARRLAPHFEADPEVVEIAALLHDYASVKDAALYENHHLHSSTEAAQILARLGYPPEKIAAVRQAIEGHRASVRVDERSAEADCLANADAMTHIEQVPSLLYLAYVRRGLDIDEGATWVRAKLERSWAKLRPDVRASLRLQYEAALEICAPSDGFSSNP